MKKYIALGLLVGSFCNQSYGAAKQDRPVATLAEFLNQARTVTLVSDNQEVKSTVIFINFDFHLERLNRIFFLTPHREEVSREATNKAEAEFLKTKTIPARLYALMIGKKALPSGTILHVNGKAWKVEDHPGPDVRTLTLQEKQYEQVSHYRFPYCTSTRR